MVQRTPLSPRSSPGVGVVEISVVMPCLNEERTVGECVRRALRTLGELGVSGEVVVVDNGSSDASRRLAEEAGARVVLEPAPGYGNALRRGFQSARGKYLLMGDCDLSYDFTELGRFLERLRSGADLVLGNRFLGEIKPGAMPWLHRLGNPVLSWALRLLFRTGAGDAQSGMRAFTREGLEKMGLCMPGMELGHEMLIKGKLAGLHIEELPITLWPDGRGRRSHLRTFRDGWRYLRLMLMCSPSFLFLVPGMAMIVLGLGSMPAVVLAGYGTYDNIFSPNFLATASLVAVSGSHLVFFGLLTKLYAHRMESAFRDRGIERFLSIFRMERGLVFGGFVVAVALALALPQLVHKIRTNELTSPPTWIFATTLLCLGIQIVFASFVIGILLLPRESRPAGIDL